MKSFFSLTKNASMDSGIFNNVKGTIFDSKIISKSRFLLITCTSESSLLPPEWMLSYANINLSILFDEYFLMLPLNLGLFLAKRCLGFQ